MAYGGGTWTTQNKTIPGSYINFVKASDLVEANNNRGIVAIPFPLNISAGSVIEITAEEFANDATTILGIAADAAAATPFREIFKHARKCVIYDLGSNKTAANAIAALEAYEWNILCVYSSTSADITSYITAVKGWRAAGIKRQVVVYNTALQNDEAVINVTSAVTARTIGTGNDAYTDPAYAAVAWVAGAEAGCDFNESVTNMTYDGELDIVANLTQAQLETALTAGNFVFHLAYGEVRVFEDINSLTTFTTKSEELRYNQTIRIIDGIANDIARVFNTKYIGKIQNNKAGRASFWADVEKYMRELERIGAIETFNSKALTVEPGESRRAIVVNMEITCVNALEILYMTVVVN